MHKFIVTSSVLFLCLACRNTDLEKDILIQKNLQENTSDFEQTCALEISALYKAYALDTEKYKRYYIAGQKMDSLSKKTLEGIKLFKFSPDAPEGALKLTIDTFSRTYNKIIKAFGSRDLPINEADFSEVVLSHSVSQTLKADIVRNEVALKRKEFAHFVAANCEDYGTYCSFGPATLVIADCDHINIGEDFKAEIVQCDFLPRKPKLIIDSCTCNSKKIPLPGKVYYKNEVYTLDLTPKQKGRYEISGRLIRVEMKRPARYYSFEKEFEVR